MSFLNLSFFCCFLLVFPGLLDVQVLLNVEPPELNWFFGVDVSLLQEQERTMNSMSEKDTGEALCTGNQCDTSLPPSLPTACWRITCKALRSSRSLQSRRLGVSENFKGVESFHCCGNTFFLMLPLFLHVLYVLYVLYAGQTTQMSPCASSTFTLASDIEPTPERPVRCICRANMEVLYM